MKINQRVIKIIINALFAALLCLFFILSVADTEETKKSVNFSEANILTHIDKLSQNGPRSIADKAENQKALEYLISTIQDYGVTEGDTLDKPAYLVQDFVANDERYQNWSLKNLVVHIPANTANRTGKAIMIMGHFDSVPMGQGSSDDGVSCGVMIEAIRYYLQKIKDGYTLSNDLIFAFVNGEEYGLYGSKAMLEEFKGFSNAMDRTKFVVNLESRGTSGTLIMFETGKNNYNTVSIFSELNKNVFTCSIATMIYDMMPNYTDFTTFKDVYQGVNMANIGQGENYHTQNDNPVNVKKVYLTQQAQIIEGLIEQLANYRLEKLYDASSSAIFFTYLNAGAVIYNNIASIIFAVLALLLIVSNIVVSIVYRKQNNILQTLKAIGGIVIGLIIAVAITYLSYIIFQLVAVVFGVIDIHMIGTITYSNTALVIGIAILALAVCSFTTHFACKFFKIEKRDMTRAFAYTHAFWGAVISFALPSAGYLFIFGGILLTANELIITCLKNFDLSSYHCEVLATAICLPIVIPVIFLATAALGMKMAYVYGAVFALTLFGAGICMTNVCEYFSVRTATRAIRLAANCKKAENKAVASVKVSAWEGALHVLAIAMAIFFIVCAIPSNASVNLQGKQSVDKLPYDDALVYVVDENGQKDMRVYDLNSYRALKPYAPNMEYDGQCYTAKTDISVSANVLSALENNKLEIIPNVGKTTVYLTITSKGASSFTITDSTGERNFSLGDGKRAITIHSACTLTIDGSAAVDYKEVVRDYAELIPASYKGGNDKLHFNLWLLKTYNFN